MKTSHKGFSLIELLVVIAIIALLTAIVTGNFTQSRGKSRDAKRVSDLAQLQLALELFFDRCSGYPPLVGGVIATTATLASCPSGAGITLGTFISKIPSAPLTGETYTYAVNSVTPATDYVLKTVLEYPNATLDGTHSNFQSFSPATDCSATLAYCVQPK